MALGLGSLLPLTRARLAWSLCVQILGVALLGIVGTALFVTGRSVGSPFRSGLHPAVGIDPLSGFYLLVIAITAVPTLIYAVGYLPGVHRTRAVAGLGGAFVLALVGVVCARDVIGFLACWELMTILPAAAVLVAKPQKSVREAMFEYLAITHLGGVGVWLALLILAEHGALGVHGLAGAGSSLEVVVGIAAVVGFGTKAGLVPFHSWLPRAHPVAPSHLSALMSGVMIKVALYGLIRVCFWWLAPAPAWLGITLLAIGGISALGGVSYALLQRELKELLAFSSIENAGVISLALGASIVLARDGQHQWAAIAFAAALLHTINHAAFKALLFLGAGAVERAAGTLKLDALGGVLTRMPWTGAGLAIGVIAIAGIPPLNGFASEWLVLESLLHGGLQGGALRVTLSALALAAFAATAGLAVFCFSKVGGLVLLGRPRVHAAQAAGDPNHAMRAGMVCLAACCIGLGLAPGLLLPFLVALRPTGPSLHETAGLWLPGTGGLATLGLAMVLGLGTLVLVRLRGERTAPAPVWICGQQEDPALAWTSAGFTSALRMSFDPLVQAESVVSARAEGGVVQEIRYAQHVPNLFDRWVATPIRRGSLGGAGIARRVQSGSLTSYVSYLVALVLALLAFARLVG